LHKSLKDETQKFVVAIQAGELNYRGNPDAIHNEFKDVIFDVNQIVNKICEPISVSAEYLDRISKGYFPMKIEAEYKGDFLEMRNNINQIIEVLNGLGIEIAKFLKVARQGEFDKIKIDISQFSGSYKGIVKGLNEIAEVFTIPINEVSDVMTKIADGHIDIKVQGNYFGIFLEMKNACNTSILSINQMQNSIDEAIQKQAEGEMSARCEVGSLKGAYLSLVGSINEMLETFVQPVGLTAEYLDRISKGYFPMKIQNDYKGDFYCMVENVNACIDTLSGIGDVINRFLMSVKQGQLTAIHFNEADYSGSFKGIVKGLNQIALFVSTPVLEVSDILNKIASGETSHFVSGNYNGVFNEMKIACNSSIEIFNKMQSSLNDTITKQKEGNMDARCNLSDMPGIYYELLSSTNQALDSIILPIYEAIDIMNHYAQGNFTSDLRVLPGKQIVFTEALDSIKQNIGFMYNDTILLSESAEKGDFKNRADITKHHGDYQKVIIGFNKTLDKISEKTYWYEAILDSFPFPISVTDMDMNWTFFNKASVAVIGKSRAEFIGKKCSNWNADICNTEKCGIACLRNGVTTSFFTQPGANRDFQVDTTYLLNEDGKKIGHIELVQDISKSKRSASYNQLEINKLSDNLKLIASGNLNIDSSISAPDEFTLEEYKNFQIIYDDLKTAVGSIKKLIEDTNKLADFAAIGELSQRIDASQHQGDFRKVIDGFNQTLNNVIEPLNIAAKCVAEIAMGEISDKINNNFQGEFKKLVNNINLLIDANTDIIHKAKKISEGILYVKLENRSSNDLLMIALNGMVQSLAKILKEFSETSNNITSAGGQLNQSATILAQSSNEQAASTEQISSSVEELLSTMNQTTENAIQTNQLASSSSQKILAFQKEVAGMLQSMTAISEKIKQIKNITYKTDMLAINAAIEAAKAGEAGRGFNVVATEVRSLAENNQKFANEIELLSQSLLDKSINTSNMLAELVPEIQKTLNLVSEITYSNKEQLSGINQINSAVQQLTNVTQQNMAVSEELSAASEEFIGLAESMQNEVDFFKFDDSESTTIADLQSLLDNYNSEILRIKNKLSKHKSSQKENENYSYQSQVEVDKTTVKKKFNSGITINLNEEDSDQNYTKF